MTLHLSSVLDGVPVADAAGTYVSVNPSDTTDVVAEVGLGDAKTVLEAARVARGAQPAWAAVPAPARGRVIAAFGRLVEANAGALAALVTREVGKPAAEARGEVQEVVDTCDFFLGEGRRLYGQTVPSELPDKQLFTVRAPLGVAMIVTAGNFPVAVPSWYVVPALLCGNAVVWKPAEYSAGLAAAFHALALAAGVPAAVLGLVYAEGEQAYAGLELALDAGLVDKVGFTGSTEVGRLIGALCGAHLQSPCLELGGKNPMVVAADADLDRAVEGALFSGFGTAGQRCTSLGTVLVHQSVHDDFLARFDTVVRAAAVGDPTDPRVLYGPLLTERFAAGMDGHLARIRDHHTVHGSTGRGRITAANPRDGFVGDPAAGFFYHPTVVDGVRPDDVLFTEETFGPVVGVTTYSTVDEAVALANRSGYGLSAAVYTRSPETAFRFQRGVRAGMVSICNSTSGAEAHLPFGGNGRSGNGSRQSGMWALDQFSRWQAVNWDFSGRLQKAQTDTTALPPGDPDFRLRPTSEEARMTEIPVAPAPTAERPALPSALDAIGHTPLVPLCRLTGPEDATVLVKLEYFNPTGSYKDRMALAMVSEAERRGQISPDRTTIVEYTGGSTGSSLSFVCAVKGYPLRIVSSDAFSEEKLRTMTSLGAELLIVPSDCGRITPDLMPRIIDRTRELATGADTYWTDQFNNPDNAVGQRTMGCEILAQTGGRVDAFVVTVGTAGCAMGVAYELKRHSRDIHVAVVEPSTSAVISGGPAGSHRVEGVALGFVPPLLDPGLYDEVVVVDEDEARVMTRRLATEEGIFAGTSTGMNVVAALRAARRLGPGATVVTAAVDSGLKYVSTDLYPKS